VGAGANKKCGHMVARQSRHIDTLRIVDVRKVNKRVEPDHDVVRTARAVGISFGD